MKEDRRYMMKGVTRYQLERAKWVYNYLHGLQNPNASKTSEHPPAPIGVKQNKNSPITGGCSEGLGVL